MFGSVWLLTRFLIADALTLHEPDFSCDPPMPPAVALLAVGGGGRGSGSGRKRGFHHTGETRCKIALQRTRSIARSERANVDNAHAHLAPTDGQRVATFLGPEPDPTRVGLIRARF